MYVRSDAESGQPTQAGPLGTAAPVQARAARPRLRWRAVIHAGEKFDPARGQQPVAWHLADCDDPARLEAHCKIGRHLITSDGNPDGHCHVTGACPRCVAATSPGGPS